MSGERPSDPVKRLIPRGFIESFILFLLKEEGPLHGYGIMNRIKERTGFWKPSPGSIYPALNSMVRKGLIEESEQGREKRYTLTEKGARIAEDMKDLRATMKERVLSLIADILDMDREEARNMLEEIKARHETSPFCGPLHDILGALHSLADEPSKVSEAKKILREAERKLRKLREAG